MDNHCQLLQCINFITRYVRIRGEEWSLHAVLRLSAPWSRNGASAVGASAADHSPSLFTCTMLPWPLSPRLQHFSPLFSAALCLMPAWHSFSLNAEHAKACQNYSVKKDVGSIYSKWKVLLLVFSFFGCFIFLGAGGLSLIWTVFEPCLHFPKCESRQLPLQVL